MIRPTSALLAGLAALLLSIAAAAGPVTTVPWNGYPGAISFTFDDGYVTHLDNVVPLLDTKNVKGTFFVCSGTTFSTNLSRWIQAAQNGHEITNHTLTHQYLPNVSAATVESEVNLWADSLRHMSSAFRVLTLAYPVCGDNDAVDVVVNQKHFIARTCGASPDILPYRSEPSNWMRVTSNMVNVGYQSLFDSKVDAVAPDSGWLVLLLHSIGDAGAVPTAEVSEYIDRAKSKNLWIDTYERIGAYWRASFTFNRATPSATTDGWNVSWTSPHPMMPATVLLRVKLDRTYFGNTVSVFQGSTRIMPQPDGSYIIDFMRLQMSVKRGDVTSADDGKAELAAVAQTRTLFLGNRLEIEGVAPGSYIVDLYTPAGARIESHAVTLAARGQTVRVGLNHRIGFRTVVAVVRGVAARTLSERIVPHESR